MESVGEGVEEITVGDTVVPSILADYGECVDCKSPKSSQCSKFQFQISPWMHRDGTRRFSDINEGTAYHFAYVSSFSDYKVVDIAHITEIDSANPLNRACLPSCCVSTGVGAAWKAANVEAGSTVAIFRLRIIGLG